MYLINKWHRHTRKKIRVLLPGVEPKKEKDSSQKKGAQKKITNPFHL